MASNLYLLSKDGLDLNKNPDHQFLINYFLDSQNAWSEISKLEGATKKDIKICQMMLSDIKEMLNLVVTFPQKNGIQTIKFKVHYFKNITALNITELSDGIQQRVIHILGNRLK